jgi:antitoxin (DNA-binding transcriptional repressor) of toxin-antitoxin stability system
MKTVTIRELHTNTGKLVREAFSHGEIWITDNGHVVAKILPQSETHELPYFARRKPSALFRRLDESGKTRRGTDSTTAISEGREDRV